MNTTGRLICPSCHNPGMSDYEFYESRQVYTKKYQYLFYNRKKKASGWKCWALLAYCGCKVFKWWDPCGLCIQLCNKDSRPEVNEDDDRKCGEGGMAIVKLFLGILLAEILFMLYFFFFVWFDIYYAFCSKDKMRIVCVGDGEVIIPEKENLWRGIDSKICTEDFWNKNCSYLFKCNKCSYMSNTFQSFIGNEEVVVDVNNKNNMTTDTSYNGYNKVNTQTGEPIIVDFITADQKYNIKIQSNTSTLFSDVENNLFGKIPEYKNKNCIFMCNNNRMNPNYTMEQNQYVSGNKIIVYAN